MADLKISDAPLLPQDQITGAIKVPTGGVGNYSIQLSDLAWYVVNKENLANKTYVDLSSKSVKDSLDNHIADKANPHNVTKAQVGLSNVDNTADLDKPVSNATQSAIITATNGLATEAYVDAKNNTKADISYVDKQDNLKASIDYVNSRDGDLTTLTTTDKTSLVKAINEVKDEIKGVAAQKLDTGIIATAKQGGVERSLSAKLVETISINDFYDRTDGDYTAAFERVSALGCNILIPRKFDGTRYKVTGSVELTNGTRLIGAGQPEIDLCLTDTYDRGFWIKDSGSVIDGITINKYQSATNGDGRWLNAVCVNDFGGGSKLVKNWRLSNIIINDVGVEKHNTISIYGNSSDGLIENVTVNGNGTYSLMVHWGYDSPFTNTYHPRDIVIRNFSVNGDIDVTYGIYVSAGHNITIENTRLRNVTMGIVIAAGEYGGLYADTPSKGRVLSGMVIDGYTVDGIRNDSLYISARGNSRLREEKLKERWHGLDENINLAIKNVTVTRDVNTYSGQVRIEHFKNLTIDGLYIKNLPDAEKITTLARILITEGVDIGIKNIDIDGAKGIIVESGKNITVEGKLLCSHPTPNSVSIGITVNGSTQIVDVASNVPAGATTVQIKNVNQNIYKGLKFVQNGNIFEFASSWHVDTVTPANNYNRVLAIVPSENTIEAGDITLLTGVQDFKFKGVVKGFYTNYLQTSPSKQIPSKCVLEDVTFDTSYNYHINLNGGDDLRMNGGEFKNGNTSGVAGISNIRLNSINYFKARGVTFDKGSARVNFGAHIVSANVATYIFEDCHWGHLLPTGARGCVYSNYSNIYVHNNTYADDIRSVGVMPMSVLSISAIGTKKIAEGSAPPINGSWNVGDIVYARSVAASGNVGWVCTTAGTSGTWKTFGAISA